MPTAACAAVRAVRGCGLEEHIGKRVNHERADEALATDATKIATGRPFCRSRGTPGRAR
jgi:Fe-S oxidoreductase